MSSAICKQPGSQLSHMLHVLSHMWPLSWQVLLFYMIDIFFKMNRSAYVWHMYCRLEWNLNFFFPNLQMWMSENQWESHRITCLEYSGSFVLHHDSTVSPTNCIFFVDLAYPINSLGFGTLAPQPVLYTGGSYFFVNPLTVFINASPSTRHFINASPSTRHFINMSPSTCHHISKMSSPLK